MNTFSPPIHLSTPHTIDNRSRRKIFLSIKKTSTRNENEFFLVDRNLI